MPASVLCQLHLTKIALKKLTRAPACTNLQVVTVKKRYEVGLEKLATTESSVADMQQELIALQPQLEVSTKETEAAMVVCASSPRCADEALLLGL